MNKIIPVKKINIFKDFVSLINQTDYMQINLSNENLTKILIIKWGAIGDVIQSSFAINAILDAYPNSDIDVNTLPSSKKFFRHDKRINKIWGFNFGKGLKKLISTTKWLKIVKSNKYDLIIDLQTNDRSRIYLAILRIFFSYPKFSIGNHSVYPYKINHNNKLSNNSPINLYQRTLLTIGIKIKSLSPSLVISNNSKIKIDNIIKSHSTKNNKIIVFIPGSSKNNKIKRWGVNNFIKLSSLLTKDDNTIILVGGNDDIDDCNQIEKTNKNIINLCNKLDLTDLIPLFDKSNIIIANDTGPTHLAACISKPLIQITGPTNPLLVKPFGKNIISIQSEIECANCYKKYCSHHSCMLGISPSYINRLIKRYI